MSLLEFFDKIANHLLTQNKRSVTKLGKPQGMYKGLSDPCGFLASKKIWKKEYNKLGINTDKLQEILGLNDDEADVVRDLQAIHDIVIPEKWPEWISMFRDVRFKAEDVPCE